MRLLPGQPTGQGGTEALRDLPVRVHEGFFDWSCYAHTSFSGFLGSAHFAERAATDSEEVQSAGMSTLGHSANSTLLSSSFQLPHLPLPHPRPTPSALMNSGSTIDPKAADPTAWAQQPVFSKLHSFFSADPHEGQTLSGGGELLAPSFNTPPIDR